MGAQFMRDQQNRYYAGNNGALGIFTYSGTYTGLDFADFLLDDLNSKGRGSATGTWGHRFWRSAFFVAGRYQGNSRFTLNLGLRYEYMQPIYEVADRQVNINTFTGKLIYPNGDYGRATYNGYPYQFMPRIGLAYQINNKLVFRAGYAYQSFMEGTGANLRTTLNPPFFIETNVTYDPRTPGRSLRASRRTCIEYYARYASASRSHRSSASGSCVGPESCARRRRSRSMPPSNISCSPPHRCRSAMSARRDGIWSLQWKPTSHCRVPVRSLPGLT